MSQKVFYPVILVYLSFHPQSPKTPFFMFLWMKGPVKAIMVELVLSSDLCCGLISNSHGLVSLFPHPFLILFFFYFFVI